MLTISHSGRVISGEIARRRPTVVAHRFLAHCLGLGALLLTVPAAAQWTTESPLPTHLQVSGVAAPSPEHVFVTTADDSFDQGGALFESLDGGVSWVQRDVPFGLGDGLDGIFFLDDQLGWTWGNRNYRTTDGGTTWEELPLLGSAYFLEFWTPTFGLTTGNFGAYVSRDGGLSWDPSPHGIADFDFADDLVGVGIAATGLYQTVDGGGSFTLAEAAASADAVAFLSSTVAMAIVDGVFARSADAGATWSRGASAQGRTRLLAVSSDVVLAWGRTGIYPDYDDRLLRSSDGGLSWSDLGEVIGSGLSTVPFTFVIPAPETIIASDGAGGIARSTDAGQTWSQTYASPGPVPGFLGNGPPAFGDAQTGYYGLGAGFVLHTTDGGASWAQISSGTAETIRDLDRFANGDLIAVAENGRVLTRAGGLGPWLLRATLSAEDLEAVQVVGPQEVVTVDRTGRLMRSADFGVTWTAGASLPVGLTAADLDFTSLLDGWVVGRGFSGAALFHTADGGDTWSPVTAFQGLYVAVDFEGSSGWAVELDGTLQRTVDGGVTWTESELPGFSLAIWDLDFSGALTGYAVGGSGYAVRSDDGGATWQTLPTPDPDVTLTALHLLGPEMLWAATDANVALYSATSGLDWAVLAPGEAGFGSWTAITASPGGEAWVGGWRGMIRHFTGPLPDPVNQSPIASYEFAASGLSVALTDTSHDPDGTLVGWLWNFGDGTTSTEPNPVHTFAGAGTFHVLLTVTDDDGATGSFLQFIVVQPGPGGTFGDFTEVTPFDPLFVTPQDEDFWVTATAAADFDGDGDLDIAVFGYYVVYNESAEDRLVLLRNDGPVSDTEWEIGYVDVEIGDLSSGASDLAWGDLDGDGDLDLAVGSNARTVIFRNNAGTLVDSGTVLPPYWEDNSQADFDLRSISWADFDNDGDLDLLLPSVFEDGTSGFRTALMRNDGPGGSGGWIFTEVDSGLAPTSHAQSFWADFDGDEDLDLLLVNLAPLTDDGFIRRYRNDGEGVFVGEDILGALTVEHGEVQWGDVDDDGDLDLLVVGDVREVGGTYNRALRIYRNDAETYVPIDVLSCIGCEGWFDLTAATWADYDSDGDIDILLAGNYNSGSQIEGRAKIYTNDGGVFSDSGTQLPAPRASGSRGGTFSWLDLDGDGDLDYFIAGQYFVPGGNGLVEAQMHLYTNDAEGQNAAPTAPSLLAIQEVGGDVVFYWNPASDDLTPGHALTYDLRLYRDGTHVSTPAGLPEPGSVGAARQWTLSGLPQGHYTWKLKAIDSAYNSGPASEHSFLLGEPAPALLFSDGFESGDLGGWSATSNPAGPH